MARSGCAVKVNCKEWEAPPREFIKISCDGSWDRRTNCSGFGCVARDEEGVVLGVKAGSFSGIMVAVEAEIRAMYKAMKWATLLNWRKCIFETDNVEVYVALASRWDYEQLATWVRSCHEWMLKYESRELEGFTDPKRVK
ncbi:hypothetical protein QQ045_016269 [Rhodiola kirilowii]